MFSSYPTMLLSSSSGILSYETSRLPFVVLRRNAMASF